MSLHTHVYNRNDGAGPWWKTAQWTLSATVRGKYRGSVMKGWWLLGNSSINRVFEVEFALGGEHSMAQIGIVLPFIARFHVGVKVPRRLLKGWIYYRREWTLRLGYIGRWAELLIASDEYMRDTGMVRYYREKRRRGDYDGPWSRAATWPGCHLTFRPELKDKLLGRKVCTTTTGEPVPVVVPMPEGNYPATVTNEVRVWKRPRWPWASQTRVDYSIDIPTGIPVPGKGENSWDIDDDALYGTGGNTVHDAVANATRAALRSREQYAGPGWVPGRGWPKAVAR